MHIKNFFLLGVFFLSSILATDSMATTLVSTTNPVELNKKPAKKNKKRSSKFKKWNESRKMIKQLFDKEFILEDLENVHLIEGCETITFNNGEVHKVEIISMDDLNVSFKPCDGQDSEERNAPLSDISSIYSKSGDLIYKGGGSAATDSKILTFSIISLVSAFLGLLWPLGVLFGPVAIIFGALALKKIKSRPGNDNGRGLALGGFISGIVITALTLGTFILFFSFFW